MSRKSSKIASLLQPHRGGELPPHYLAFFDCFNRHRYFEAHEVLEELWLSNPGGNYRFYKGLIQLAGAFVHVQKRRRGPAGALLRLADANLACYPETHQNLDVVQVLGLIRRWLIKLTACAPGAEVELLENEAPQLVLNARNG